MRAPLDSLKSIFDLQMCENKPFFPYKFNKFANKDIILKNLPPQEDYIPMAMNQQKHANFEQW